MFLIDHLKTLSTEISSYDNDHSVRYYLPKDKMSIGTIRITVTPGPINDAYIITSMDINRLIAYIMAINDMKIEMGEALVLTIRQHATKTLNDYLNGGNDNISNKL